MELNPPPIRLFMLKKIPCQRQGINYFVNQFFNYFHRLRCRVDEVYAWKVPLYLSRSQTVLLSALPLTFHLLNLHIFFFLPSWLPAWHPGQFHHWKITPAFLHPGLYTGLSMLCQEWLIWPALF